MSGGCTARFAIDAPTLIRFLNAHSDYHSSGFPRRTFRRINGVAVSKNDARLIRRWKANGGTVTRRSAERLLGNHNLTLDAVVAWTTRGKRRNPILRGEL